MKTPKDIFDNRYIYYRDALGKPPIPLEARQLIFDLMEEYHETKVKNLTIPDVVKLLPNKYYSQCGEPVSKPHKFWCKARS